MSLSLGWKVKDLQLAGTRSQTNLLSMPVMPAVKWLLAPNAWYNICTRAMRHVCMHVCDRTHIQSLATFEARASAESVGLHSPEMAFFFDLCSVVVMAQSQQVEGEAYLHKAWACSPSHDDCRNLTHAHPSTFLSPLSLLRWNFLLQ